MTLRPGQCSMSAVVTGCWSTEQCSTYSMYCTEAHYVEGPVYQHCLEIPIECTSVIYVNGNGNIR